MRSSIAILLLICAMVLPAFCQKQQEPEPDSARARELKACGTKNKEVKYSVGTDKKTHPTGEQAADKALIYVLRPSSIANKIESKLAVDGEWKGVNRGNNYFFFTLEPGLHYFCSSSPGNRSVLVLTVEAGKTYYLSPQVRNWKARNDLTVLSDDEGKAILEEAQPSTWEVK